MKYTTLVSIFLINGCSLTQEKMNTNDLLNYSYKIQGINEISNKYVTGGTGFLFEYNDNVFLISNYHVFTGKDPYTGQKIPHLPDTCTSLKVWFRDKKDDTSFIKIVHPLYDSIGKLFSVYHIDDKMLLDIAVIPISVKELSAAAKVHILTMNDIDSTTVYQENRPMYIVGFPGDYPKNGWEPKIITANSVIQKGDDPRRNPNIFFDNSAELGMSGSPTYIDKETKSTPILIGVNSLTTNPDANNPKIKGGAVYFKYCLDIIKQMIKEQKVDVDVYYQ